MEQFVLGSICTSIAWVVGLAWKDARIPRAVIRLYAVGAMTNGASLMVMGLIPILFGKGNEAITKDIASLTIDNWPWWLMGVGALIAAMPIALLFVLRMVSEIRREAEKEGQGPTP
jgi:hypothetical protein